MFKRWLLLSVSVALIGGTCGGGPAVTPPPSPSGSPVTLTVWRVFDDPSLFDTVIDRYQALRPNIQVEVIQKNFADYELEVANAIAAGIGPDIWMIRNDWLPKHVGKLQAMPEGLLGDLKPDSQGNPQTNVEVTKAVWPDVVAAEAAQGGQVFGLPLSIDTLALNYNKDHLSEARIAEPPSTWNDFVTAVEQLTRHDPNDRVNIERAGAAIGTAGNVNRATDILSILMLQNHTPMTSEDQKSALFNGAIEKTGGGLTYPGTTALEFFTGFADPKKAVYTWNNDLPNSIDAFAQGRVSMIFGYAYLERILLQKNPTLNFGIAPLPQVASSQTPRDYPTYWLEVVTRNSQHPTEAWDFIRFLAQEGDELYQRSAGKPPAKRSPTVPQPNERVLSTDPGNPFSFQATTATTWYRGTNPGKIEQILAEMIENVVTFDHPAQVAIDNAAAQVTKSLTSQAEGS